MSLAIMQSAYLVNIYNPLFMYLILNQMSFQKYYIGHI